MSAEQTTILLTTSETQILLLGTVLGYVVSFRPDFVADHSLAPVGTSVDSSVQTVQDVHVSCLQINEADTILADLVQYRRRHQGPIQ